jgi:hypothetical protein
VGGARRPWPVGRLPAPSFETECETGCVARRRAHTCDLDLPTSSLVEVLVGRDTPQATLDLTGDRAPLRTDRLGSCRCLGAKIRHKFEHNTERPCKMCQWRSAHALAVAMAMRFCGARATWHELVDSPSRAATSHALGGASNGASPCTSHDRRPVQREADRPRDTGRIIGFGDALERLLAATGARLCARRPRGHAPCRARG